MRESEIGPAIEVALARDSDRRAQLAQVQQLQEQLDTIMRAERARGLLLEKRRWESHE